MRDQGFLAIVWSFFSADRPGNLFYRGLTVGAVPVKKLNILYRRQIF